MMKKAAAAGALSVALLIALLLGMLVIISALMKMIPAAVLGLECISA